jgi:transcription initiation factor TFIIIB Brf1 subunit/transcription initiation factor TFIIB
MKDEFVCPNCRSPSVVYPDSVDDEQAHILCRGCGMIMGTLAQFRRAVQRVSASPLSGC